MFEQTFKNIDDILHKEAGCTSELDYTEQSSWLLFLKYLDALEQDKATEAALQKKSYAHIIDAEKSDLFDVLAHVAFARAPIERKVRADQARGAIRSEFSAKQQEFLDFVLGQYVAVGVGELSTEKLAPLLNLKYQHSIRDAVSDLGTPDSIAAAFSGFQRHLYSVTHAA
jgi:hypothetical protein